MPIFTIEKQYLVPCYVQITLDAPDVPTAFSDALDEDKHDWEGSKIDYENARETYVSGAWEGDTAYQGQPIGVPVEIGDPERRERMVYLLQAEHPTVSGNPINVFASEAAADVEALALVNLIRLEELYDPEDEAYSLLLPQLPAGSDWKEGLREWQRAKLIGDDTDPADMDDDELAEETEAAVWIIALPLQPGA